MNTTQRVVKNTSIMTAGDIIFRIISLFIVMYLARYLGTTGFGKYGFVFAYIGFFEILFDMGMESILIREMSSNPSTAPKLIGNAYPLRLILTLFAIILSLITITLMKYPEDTTNYVYIITITLLFLSFSNFNSTIFQANLRIEYTVYAKLAFKMVSAILIFWIIFSQGTLTHILIALVFSESVKTFISYYFSRKFVKPIFEIDFNVWKYLLKESLPVAFYGIIYMLFYRIDIIMLSFMKGDAAVGLYSAAYKISEPISIIPWALSVSLFPIMSASFKGSKERLIKSYTLGIKYLLVIMLPIAVGTTLIGYKIIFLVYGTEFTGSTTALQILIWALVFTSINSILITLLISIGKQKLNTISIALCAVLNIILNFILIQTFSFNGASIATVIANIALFFSSFYFAFKYLRVPYVHRIAIKPMICSLLMGAFVYYFIDVNIFLLVPLAGIVYLVLLLSLRSFSREDIEMIKKTLK